MSDCELDDSDEETNNEAVNINRNNFSEGITEKKQSHNSESLNQSVSRYPTRSREKVVDNLVAARKIFVDKQAEKDPLRAVLGESPPPVISQAGSRGPVINTSSPQISGASLRDLKRRRGHQSPDSDATGEQASGPKAKSPRHVKKGIIETRCTAEKVILKYVKLSSYYLIIALQVIFSDSEIETVSESTPAQNGKKISLPVIQSLYTAKHFSSLLINYIH